MSYSLCGKCGDMVPDGLVGKHECNTSSRQYRINTLESENARLREACERMFSEWVTGLTYTTKLFDMVVTALGRDNGRWPVQCVVCGKRFDSKSVGIARKKLSTGDMEYICGEACIERDLKEGPLHHNTEAGR